MGALWNSAQTAITKYRMKRGKLKRHWMVVEACWFSFLNTAIMYTLSMVAGTCQPFQNVTKHNEFQERQFFCGENEFISKLSFKW